MATVDHGTMGKAAISFVYDDVTNLVQSVEVNNLDSLPLQITWQDALGVTRSSRTWAPGEKGSITMLSLSLDRRSQKRGRLAPIVVMNLGN